MANENSNLARHAAPLPADEAQPPAEKRTVPRRQANTVYRGREHLTADEVAAMVKAARQHGRYGQRDAAAILLTYRHGLRVSELCALRWDQVNLKDRTIATLRAKAGIAGLHPLQTDELRALGALAAVRSPGAIHVLENERGGALKPGAVRKIVARAGVLAKLELPVHPHMLRHACGFALANKGKDTRLIQDYLGHRSIAATARYTALAAGRFANLWD